MDENKGKDSSVDRQTSRLKRILHTSVSVVRVPCSSRYDPNRCDPNRCDAGKNEKGRTSVHDDIVQDLLGGRRDHSSQARKDRRVEGRATHVYVLGERPERNKSVPQGRNTGCLKKFRRQKKDLVIAQKKETAPDAMYNHYRERYWACDDEHGHDCDPDDEGFGGYVTSGTEVWEGIGTMRHA